MNSTVLPPAAWGRVWRWTIAASAISALVSLVAAQGIMLILSQGLDLAGATASLVLPFILGGPMLFYMTLRTQQLREANRRLEALASTDWLTDCLNRRVFTNQVDAIVQGRAPARNALLVIDADHFKTINDRFGHHRGDEVLRLIAEAIKDSVREVDIVGRLGGEEFGVFLREVEPEAVGHAGERIRQAVNALYVQADGIAQRLSVSIGCACFDGRITFAEMFRVADRRLYDAKRSGRNRVMVDDPAAAPEAAAG